MSKDPSYPMYAQDFDMDTASWTVAEIGAYVRLLNYEWINGPLPNNISALARIARCDIRTLTKMWESEVGKKFIPNDTNMLVNRRMEEEREKRDKYLESQREAGKRGSQKRWKKDSDPISDPISDPNGEQHGENIALHFHSHIHKENKKHICAPDPSFDLFFDEFWKTYPDRNRKKIGKDQCREYCKRFKNGEREQILTGVRNYAASKGAREGYARDPIRFLKHKAWHDWQDPEHDPNDAYDW